MKYLILMMFLAAAAGVQAQEKQSLKDLLYGGKLKKDSSGVVRSTDDLSSKIDTTTKKPVETEKPKVTAPVSSVKKVAMPNADEPAVAADIKDSAVVAVPVAKENAVPAKTNTRLWKEYIDSLVISLKSEVLKSKQIKKETYYVSIDYEIGVDGLVNVVNVSATPENSFLQAQVKQMVDVNPPHLNPVLDSTNQPRKVKRKQNFTITKE